MWRRPDEADLCDPPARTTFVGHARDRRPPLRSLQTPDGQAELPSGTNELTRSGIAAVGGGGRGELIRFTRRL